ncbi:hypothetical protein MMC18_009524, partial [Xylographa bjoerkii]|nr:hypothetical protein [Xylographa bjoerkii]
SSAERICIAKVFIQSVYDLGVVGYMIYLPVTSGFHDRDNAVLKGGLVINPSTFSGKPFPEVWLDNQDFGKGVRLMGRPAGGDGLSLPFRVKRPEHLDPQPQPATWVSANPG